MSAQKTVRIELTDEQKEQIKKSSGRDVEAVNLSLEALEERIAPTSFELHSWSFGQ